MLLTWVFLGFKRNARCRTAKQIRWHVDRFTDPKNDDKFFSEIFFHQENLPT